MSSYLSSASASILEYDVEQGRLCVEHAFPADAHPTPKAYIDMNVVLGSMKRQDLGIGMWLNTVGYVRPSLEDSSGALPSLVQIPIVQAVMMWPAGSLNVQRYETTLQATIAHLRTSQRPPFYESEDSDSESDES
ncbi:uncharacterized protein AB675_8055 [Cyphellophora attinorum]|uniref:Uncharacterized protein n=1 Tax=Cyphellophora attinorum TaxID=1664694 RepID=A0A0N0NN06_9EURO|nr:uncharacterized protein AB675_8055 [Phialophora attinorum]KPI41061.1 hypothetical protein AB675_8055 [Phialophora attinorum]